MNVGGLVERWVGLYTRGLPAVVRRERRAELASDLWEHRAAFGDGAGAQLALAWRCLRGMPADLHWRRERRQGRRLRAFRALGRGLGWAVAGASYVFLLVNHGFAATPVVGLDLYGADLDPDGLRTFSRICAALLALLVAGAVLLIRRPRLGAALVSVGALGSPLAFLWGAFAFAPAAASVTTAAIVLARRRGTRRPSPPSAPRRERSPATRSR